MVTADFYNPYCRLLIDFLQFGVEKLLPWLGIEPAT